MRHYKTLCFSEKMRDESIFLVRQNWRYDTCMESAVECVVPSVLTCSLKLVLKLVFLSLS